MTVAAEASEVAPMTDEVAMLAFACGIADHILDILQEVRHRVRVGIEDGGSWRLVKSGGSGHLNYCYRARWVVRVRNVLKDTQPSVELGGCGFRVLVDARTVAIKGSRVSERWESEIKDFTQAWLVRGISRCAATFRAQARLNSAQ